MSETQAPEPSLHDWLALGDVDVALSSEARLSDSLKRQNDEIHRLPLFLRLLSGAQPLSSIPSITQDFETAVENPTVDPLVNKVVCLLEDVAATYSAAEGIDALTSYHAPTICRKISRLAPLRRGKRKPMLWDVQQLAPVAASPVGGPRKRRRQSLKEHDIDSTDEIQAGDDHHDDDDDDDDMSVDSGDCTQGAAEVAAAAGNRMVAQLLPTSTSTSRTNRSRNTEGNNSLLAGVTAEDSQEAMVIKTLSEIATLVVESLEPVAQPKEDEEGNPQTLVLAVKTDSLLSEPSSRLNSVGAMGGSDLGATLAALMHHAPVLRHRHVAYALCRAAVLQSADLVVRMGANNPTAVPCLLRGCIDAFVHATSIAHGHVAITNAAKAAVRSLAGLSHRESCRVRTTLQQSCLMVDVQLELAMDQGDQIAAACLINEHMSKAEHHKQVEESPQTDQVQDKQNPSAQNPSDVLSESSHRRGRGHDSNVENAVSNAPLHRLLIDNRKLAERAQDCILGALDALVVPDGSRISLGRAGILVRAYSWLMFAECSSEPQSNRQASLKFHVGGAQTLSRLQKALFPISSDAEAVVPSKASMDEFYGLLMCACLLSLTRSLQIGEHELENSNDLCGNLLKDVLLTASISIRTNVFRSKLASLLKGYDVSTIHALIWETLAVGTRSCTNATQSMHDVLINGYMDLSRQASDNIDLSPIIADGLIEAAVLEDPSGMIQAFELNLVDVPMMEGIVHCIMDDSSKCQVALSANGVCSLITVVASASTNVSTTRLPLVLPVHLQSQAQKIDWRSDSMDSKLFCQFLFQLSYCLSFLDHEPHSSFSVDPRELPLAEALAFCKASSSSEYPELKVIEFQLERTIRKHTPEVIQEARMRLVNAEATHAFPCSNQPRLSRRALLEGLSNSIRRSVADKTADPSGSAAEQSYVTVRARLTTAETDTTCARALLSTPHSPVPYFTYSILCRDPLVLLKCPLSVWKCRGLRRIALSMLWRLLEANQHVIMQTSHAEENANELLAARNAVVARCLIIATSGGALSDEKSTSLRPFHCSMTTAMVRALVAKQRGLVAMLVKQGLPDPAIDWLVEFVPETMNDSHALVVLLSERSSLTATERLVTADATLRIAVAHGSRDENEAVALAYAALSRLVSSFFLVLGPVGVPVNVLCEVDGTDVTQECRKAMFRILGALQQIRSNRASMRNECGMALQRLAGLCKGESIMSGVAGTVANRRKNILKDIWDAVISAINAMGGAVML